MTVISLLPLMPLSAILAALIATHDPGGQPSNREDTKLEAHDELKNPSQQMCRTFIGPSRRPGPPYLDRYESMLSLYCTLGLSSRSSESHSYSCVANSSWCSISPSSRMLRIAGIAIWCVVTHGEISCFDSTLMCRRGSGDVEFLAGFIRN